MSSPRSQSTYQVRFDWGLEGAAAIANDAHLVVWADAIPTPGAPDPLAVAAGPSIAAASVGSCAAVAQWVLDRQAELGYRAIVAVVAAGTDDGRFAVEDFFAAGAVIDALATLGIDSNSPEAAAAYAAYEGLRNATVHLASASVTGQGVDRELLASAKAANAETALKIIRS